MKTPPRAAALAAAALLALAAAAASAQSLFAPSPQTAPDTAPETAPEPGPEPAAPEPEPAASDAQAVGTVGAAALAGILRDEAAREALIAQLEAAAADAEAALEGAPAAAVDAAAETSAGAGAGAAAPAAGLGRRLALATQEGAEGLVDTARGFVAGLAETQRRLAVLWGRDGAEIVAIGWLLAPVIAVTALGFLALRLAARRLYARWGRASRGMGGFGRAVVVVGSVAVDALVVVAAWAAGYVVTLFAFGEAGRIGVVQTLYLNAFLVVELAKVAMRAFLSPASGDLRPVPMSDARARFWARRAAWLISLLGYGLLLLAPVVAQTVDLFTGRAVEVLVFSLAVFWAMALVIRRRREPVAWLERREAASGGDPTLRLIKAVTRYWHWPALIWLATLFVIAVSRSDSVLPLLAATGRVVGVLALGAAAGGLLARAARHGVTLPPDFSSNVPMLEQRLNGFIRKALGALRLVILAVTLGFAIDASGVGDLGGWLGARLGENFLGALVAVAAIVTAAFLIWLGVVSWVDYKLNPDRAVVATQRQQTLLTLLKNAVTVALALITLMIALSELGLDIGPLLASAGVLGLAIGFGAQKLVQDIITGVFIQLENAFNVGDVVTVAGTSGVVEKLTIRSVSLRDLNGVFHIIPFSSVDIASNFMRGFAYHVADFGVAYREDVDEVRRIMHEAFAELKLHPEVGPMLIGDLEYWGVDRLGDSAVVHRARLRCLPGKQWAAGRAYNAILKKRCDAAGVEIPFPHMTVWFGQEKTGGAPPLRHARAPDAREAAAASPAGAPGLAAQ